MKVADNTICPECAHEWNEAESTADLAAQVLDANGAALQNGDTVILIKDLKVKGSSMVIKQGTKSKAYACRKAITTSAANRRQRDEFKIRIRQKSLTAQKQETPSEPVWQGSDGVFYMADFYAKQPLP